MFYVNYERRRCCCLVMFTNVVVMFTEQSAGTQLFAPRLWFPGLNICKHEIIVSLMKGNHTNIVNINTKPVNERAVLQTLYYVSN